MKKLYLVLLLLCVLHAAQAQKKYSIDGEKLAQLVTVQENINLLYRLREAYQHVYAGSTAWVYQQTNSDSKLKLIDVIHFEYPAIKQKLVSQAISFQDKELTTALDTLFTNIDKMVLVSGKNMLRLVHFEDYEDEARLWASKSVINTAIIPLFTKIDKQFISILYKERQKFQSLFNELTLKSKGKKINVEPDKINAVAHQAGRLDSLQQLKYFCWKLYQDATNWVYMPGYLEGKKEMKETMNEFRGFKQAFFSSTGSKRYPFMQQVLLDSASKSIDSLVARAVALTEKLSSDTSYQNITTLFMAENEIESELTPRYRYDIEKVLNSISGSIRTDLMFLLHNYLREPHTMKKNDIIKMLEGNVGDLELLITTGREEFEKQNPLFAYEALNNFDRNELVEALISTYDKLFTHDEVKQIVAFQQSAAGKKLRLFSREIHDQTALIVNAYFRQLQERQKKIRGIRGID